MAGTGPLEGVLAVLGEGLEKHALPPHRALHPVTTPTQMPTWYFWKTPQPLNSLASRTWHMSGT